MAANYSKAKNSKIPVSTILGILGFVLVVVATILLLTYNQNRRKVYTSYMKAYSQLSINPESKDDVIQEKNSYKQVSLKTTLGTIKKGELVIIYIGNTSNTESVTEIGMYDFEFKNNQEVQKRTKTILYLNKTAEEKDEKVYTELKALGIATDIGKDRKVTRVTQGIPRLLAYYDGKLIANRIDFTEGSTARSNIKQFFSAVASYVKDK